MRILYYVKNRGKIDEREIFSKNNHVFIFINLKFTFNLVTILLTDLNISNFIAALALFYIYEKNLAIKILKHQVNHVKLLLIKQLFNKHIYISKTIVITKLQ